MLGRFTRLRELGRGGMGVVYSAHDELLARDVALKTIRADRAGALATARILREAKALARLSHPNVVQLHDASVADARIFLTMEYVDGRTLRAWLSEKSGRREILDAFIQAGHGLAAAHAAGLIHRDIKPDNILVGADGRVRVVDFGLVAPRGDLDERRPTQPDAPAEETLSRHGAVLGTPGYMAPEQLRGEPADARSDQFSFCVALFEALHGRRPFAAEDGAVTRSAIFRGRVDDEPGDVPAWLHAVLLVPWKDHRGSGPTRRNVQNRNITLWSIGPSDLLVGVLFGLVAHLGMQSMRAPDAVAGTRSAHGWSAYESVAGIPSPRGLPCGPGPRELR